MNYPEVLKVIIDTAKESGAYVPTSGRGRRKDGRRSLRIHALYCKIGSGIGSKNGKELLTCTPMPDPMIDRLKEILPFDFNVELDVDRNDGFAPQAIIDERLVTYEDIPSHWIPDLEEELRIRTADFPERYGQYMILYAYLSRVCTTLMPWSIRIILPKEIQ